MSHDDEDTPPAGLAETEPAERHVYYRRADGTLLERIGRNVPAQPPAGFEEIEQAEHTALLAIAAADRAAGREARAAAELLDLQADYAALIAAAICR